MTASPLPDVPVTTADESFRHQVVAPAAWTAHMDPAWAERCWHLVNLGEGWVLGAGRATWPHGGRRTAVAGLNTGEVQHARRVREPFTTGADPDRPDVGPIHIEAVDPLRRVRLVLDDPDCDFGFDLTFTARFPPVATRPNRIERGGEVVTDYMNFFQSGVYSGVVSAGGVERRIVDRAGFRDRGWGLRKHEGAAGRGMHIFCGAELPEESVYLLLYEDASGRRVFTNGWLINAAGVVDTVVAAQHDLQLDGRRLVRGSIGVQFGASDPRTLTFAAEGRLYMETVGYTTDPGRSGPGCERYDVTDPSVRAQLDGLFDNACRFVVGGVEGHGYVEVGLGMHARYRPEDAG